MNRLVNWLKVIKYFILSFRCNKYANLLTAKDTIKKIISGNLSIARLGDGELKILEGKSIHYQDVTKSLSINLKKVIEDYINNETRRYLLCMPNEYLKCNGFEIAKRREWVAAWSHFRFYFYNYFDKSIEYGDSFLFARKYKDMYKEIWRLKKLVVFVHNDKAYALDFESKYNIKTIFVQIPINNAYEQIEKIILNIRNVLKNTSIKKEDCIVLISAGPCAKIIVYMLSNENVQAIDTGHCWDDPLSLRNN